MKVGLKLLKGWADKKGKCANIKDQSFQVVGIDPRHGK